MPTLSETHQPPAESTQKGVLSVIQSALNRTVSFLLPCRHSRVSLPIQDRQRCLDCGASRLYLFTSDFERADTGIFMGKWRPATYEAAKAQDARQVLRKSEALRVALMAQPEGMSLFEFTAAVKYPEVAIASAPTNRVPFLDYAMALSAKFQPEVR